jgi:hypothetical protein
MRAAAASRVVAGDGEAILDEVEADIGATDDVDVPQQRSVGVPIGRRAGRQHHLLVEDSALVRTVAGSAPHWPSSGRC